MTMPEFSEKPFSTPEQENFPAAPPARASSHLSLSKLTFLFYSFLGITTLPFLYWREGTLLPSFLWGKVPFYQQILWGFSVGIAFVFLSIVSSSFFESLRRAEYDFKKMLGQLSVGQILWLAFWSSVGEEFFFRGLLQPSIGLSITSLIFGLAHPPLTKNLRFYPLVAAVVGAVLGWLFIATGSILTPIVAHFTINSINLYRIQKLPSFEENSCIHF